MSFSNFHFSIIHTFFAKGKLHLIWRHARYASMPSRRVIIFEIANWKVQIENFIFPIFIFQLFHTLDGRGQGRRQW
ncbi:MAG: hypothetical protein AUJ18_10615 [Candidatus Hydrogenedentes bacterium CG1_02_42_14]|nr:MAG: hypothetical protein AUJ18_10615 [Candidatus Hydrogenedentes bacterium CG1_02_42_14]